ncbi:MAG TPA: NAD+ synthase [Gemmatimonadales bacterium]|nr:NAD+ synthase [Gemmatimonadales bacterium]
MLRLAVAQFKPAKGEYAANLKRIGGLLARLGERPDPPELVILPEAAMAGYLLEGGVREVAVTAGKLFEDLEAQRQTAGGPPLDVVVGFYERWRDRLYNSAIYATLGGPAAGIVHVHRKVFLPTYGVLDEERFVEAGHEVRVFETRWGKAALLICEDAWHSLPTMVAALRGAQLVIIPSASPARGMAPGEETIARPANVARWERIARSVAEEHGVWVAVAQLVGFEGGKGFAGGSVVVTPRGEIQARGPLWEEALIETPVDLGEIARARADQPLLADLETQLPHLLRSLERPPAPVEYDRGTGGPRAAGRPVGSGLPVASAAAAADPLAIDCALVEQWLVEFLREEVKGRRGFSRAVIGLSGGVDSAVTAYLAARALGPENVWGFMLPYRTSSPESLAHAQLVVQALGIQSRTVDITAAVDGYVAAAEPEADGSRRGNVMARMRMIVLFDQSAKLRALALGTGNKTERLFGYFTWHADDSPPINPLGDLFKSQVWALARHLGVPQKIVEKPATADLIKGQTDEGDLGISYAKADRILHWLLRGFKTEEIVALGFTVTEVELVERRLNSTHWKRRLPTVAMLSQAAIGDSYLRPVDY